MAEYARRRRSSRGTGSNYRGGGRAPPTCLAWSPPTHPFPCWAFRLKAARLNGVDSLLSIVQMPAGIPVATLAIGNAGATNAALLAASILGNKYPAIRSRLEEWRERQTQAVLEDKLT